MDLQNIMPYFLFALPILIACIISKRYNFLFGVVSFFAWSYFIYFIILNTPIIQEDFQVACGLDVGATMIQNNIVIPMQDFFVLLFTELKMSEIVSLLNKEVTYLVFFIVVYIVFQIVSSTLRTKRVREIRELKRRR